MVIKDLRRLFLSVGIIAVGLAMIAPWMRPGFIVSDSPRVIVCFYFFVVGQVVIGFGILHPFKRGWVGAVIVIVGLYLVGLFGPFLLSSVQVN